LKIVPFDELRTSDLYVDACYQGRRVGNAGDDPLPRLLRVDSQGGFRKRGKVAGKLEVLVLTSSMNDPDWPDALDRETGVFTYYGDNKKPGRELHETGRHGNLILQAFLQPLARGQKEEPEYLPSFCSPVRARGGT